MLTAVHRQQNLQISFVCYPSRSNSVYPAGHARDPAAKWAFIFSKSENINPSDLHEKWRLRWKPRLSRDCVECLSIKYWGTSSKVPIVNSAAFSASFELSGFSSWNTRYPLVAITWDWTPPNTKATFCKRSRSRSWLVYALGRKSHAPETNLCSQTNVQNKPWINIEPFWTLRSSGHWGLASHR